MKKYLLIFAVASLLLPLSGCGDSYTNKMTDDDPADYDIVYGLRQVVQYDPMNINGINIVSKFDFFSTYRLTLHYTDRKISAVTYSDGDVPFSPYDFTVPDGQVPAYLDMDVSPYALRLTATGDVIAYFVNGEFSVTFQLDSPQLSYKYTFKKVVE